MTRSPFTEGDAWPVRRELMTIRRARYTACLSGPDLDSRRSVGQRNYRPDGLPVAQSRPMSVAERDWGANLQAPATRGLCTKTQAALVKPVGENEAAPIVLLCHRRSLPRRILENLPRQSQPGDCGVKAGGSSLGSGERDCLPWWRSPVSSPCAPGSRSVTPPSAPTERRAARSKPEPVKGRRRERSEPACRRAAAGREPLTGGNVQPGSRSGRRRRPLRGSSPEPGVSWASVGVPANACANGQEPLSSV